MLGPKSLSLYFNFISLLIFSAMTSIFISCTPTATTPQVDINGSVNNTNNTAGNNYPDPVFPLSGIFIQEGVTRSASNISLPANFSDAFLVRGSSLSQYLRVVPNSTKFCFVAKYSISSQDKYLILSGKPKSYTDFSAHTTEFYLQVEPSNSAANSADCSYMLQLIPSPNLNFSFSQLCSTCTSTVTSSGLKLYQPSTEAPNLNVTLLTLSISGSSTSSGNLCSESITCQSTGYDCCLNSQCVKDGAVRPGASYEPGYTAAAADVSANPINFLLYPEYYFICNSSPPSNGSSEVSTDPSYLASVRLMELTHLYQCMNKVDGEFSYCTKKITDADAQTNPFTLPKDDITFRTINPSLPPNNLVKAVFAGKTLYQNNAIVTGAGITLAGANDTLSGQQQITLTEPVPTNAFDKTLYLTYKVDGACEKISVTLAKCTKTYVYKSSDTSKTTYHGPELDFLLPSYADLSNPSLMATANIIVKVSGITVVEDAANTWGRQSGGIIRFAPSYQLYQNQEIEITYFSGQGADLTSSKVEAQTKVNTTCACTSTMKCNLAPVYTAGALTNYECVYEVPSTEPPANQTVVVSNKNVPHRYFDANGVNYDENYAGALPQELNEFKYTNNDVLKPNNVGTGVYVGFNEINGSFTATNPQAARPAKLVRVKKDKIYDLYVGNGSYSSCLTCGSDYYSSLQKIFPQNFAGGGGGYTPDKYESSRQSNSTIYRSDDLLYGRACFVPATMIPWTHKVMTSPIAQRQARLKGQHLLFANGYQRDWFGFDYGSIIGSFDGVSWFSIGNGRQIRATTNKLYLAVNTYFGDLSVDNTFSINVLENVVATNLPTHDTQTTGAECQRSHYCSNDNDCYRQLGYDYSCQNVGGIFTTWPQFDANANEIIGSSTKTISSIVGGTNGQSKRCVYRGRGTPCINDLLTNASGTTFNGSSLIGNLSCSPNNSCTPLSTALRFNHKISRFANTPVSQNAVSADPVTRSDAVGLGARILGRPYSYYGKETISSIVSQTALTQNNVLSICTPGRNVGSSTRTYDMNRLLPTQVETSDKIFGTGPTMSGSMNAKYLNACPATDAIGVPIAHYDLALGSSDINLFSITQNMSSNLLDIAPLNTVGNTYNVFSSVSGSEVSAVGYQKNACLRAPGAACFSDMECGPSSFVAGKARPANLSSVLNAAEEKFWEEDLICGNVEFKNALNGLNPDYDLKKNVCCRDVSKTLTVYTETGVTGDPEWCDTTAKVVKVAGINTAINNPKRYSRVHTGYDKMTCNTTEISTNKTFALSVNAINAVQRMLQIDRQFKTLDAINQRTCCTQNWVRSFHPTENGGGHTWGKSKSQVVNKEMFKHISWNPATPLDGDLPFECSQANVATINCEIRNLTDPEKKHYLDWGASLELIGIPQAAIKTNQDIYQLVNDAQYDLAPGLGITHSAAKVPLLDSVKAVQGTYNYDPANGYTAGTLTPDFEDQSNSQTYYSGSNYNAYNMGSGKLKKVFSESEFNCCIPSGKEILSTVTASQCCTGSTGTQGGKRVCCLPNYTDITLYLNRYVSSEGRGLPDSFYDKNTGYITDPEQVRIMAIQKGLCCSGNVAFGVIASKLPIPLNNGTFIEPVTPSNSTVRFNYRTDSVDDNPLTGSIGSNVNNKNLRWNNHVYCVP